MFAAWDCEARTAAATACRPGIADALRNARQECWHVLTRVGECWHRAAQRINADVAKQGRETTQSEAIGAIGWASAIKHSAMIRGDWGHFMHRMVHNCSIRGNWGHFMHRTVHNCPMQLLDVHVHP